MLTIFYCKADSIVFGLLSLLFYKNQKINTQISLLYNNKKIATKGVFIIKYEIYTQTGVLHASQGKENQDSVRVVENCDCLFCILSDGAGSSEFAKQASNATVDEAACYLKRCSSDLFDEQAQIERVKKELVYNIQQALFEKTKNHNADLSDMMCTLLIIGIDKKNKRYITIHVGDGLIAKMKNNKVDIISYPENGITKQYTYFVNSPDVFKHLRVSSGKYTDDELFFVSTDGCFENCNSSKEYKKRILEIGFSTRYQDDATYCIINQCMV